MVDGSSPATLGKVSQLLYTLLVDPILVARRTPFFIAVNKHELMDSSSSSATAAPAKERSSAESGSESDEEDSAEGATGVAALVARLEGMLDKTRDLQSTMSELGTDGETSVRTLGRLGQTFRSARAIVSSDMGRHAASVGSVMLSAHLCLAVDVCPSFSFSHSACPITVGGVSAAKGDIDELLQFLQAH